MLTDITIKNFAIIDSLHVTFSSGLNILTGETGAGKSIIIDAVNLILGGRASSELIRSGEEDATVQALFDLRSYPGLVTLVTDFGVECDGDLLVKRVISRSGKNRIFINGGLSTLSILAELSRRFINIYGQHESQTLLKVENHLFLLDGCASLKPVRSDYAALYRELKSIDEEIRRLEQGEREAFRRIDLLEYQIEDIRKAELYCGEEEQLEHELNLLLHAGKLLSKSQGAYDLLYGEDLPVLGSLRKIKSAIDEVAAIDNSVTDLRDLVASAFLQLEDAALSLRDYAARIETDPDRVRFVEERLEVIHRLKKKYGESIVDILEYLVTIESELAALKERGLSIEELNRERQALRGNLDAIGAKLTSMRVAGARELEAGLERELSQLAMSHASFSVMMEKLSEPRESGFERVEFLFSSNPGEPLKPLAKIASGGELSRLMLALKQLHPESDVPTLVFDEVDSGIGGAVSSLVGKKLRRVAAGQQVLCITHLPQVAAFADHHFNVAKIVYGGRTRTEVTNLDTEGRIGEIARMLGGIAITDKTREHAKEMIEGAQFT